MRDIHKDKQVRLCALEAGPLPPGTLSKSAAASVVHSCADNFVAQSCAAPCSAAIAREAHTVAHESGSGVDVSLLRGDNGLLRDDNGVLRGNNGHESSAQVFSPWTPCTRFDTLFTPLTAHSIARGGGSERQVTKSESSCVSESAKLLGRENLGWRVEEGAEGGEMALAEEAVSGVTKHEIDTALETIDDNLSCIGTPP